VREEEVAPVGLTRLWQMLLQQPPRANDLVLLIGQVHLGDVEQVGGPVPLAPRLDQRLSSIVGQALCDRRPQQRIMASEGRPHGRGRCFPEAGAPGDVGEQPGDGGHGR
jgi:hypothetical protein